MMVEQITQKSEMVAEQGMLMAGTVQEETTQHLQPVRSCEEMDSGRMLKFAMMEIRMIMMGAQLTD